MKRLIVLAVGLVALAGSVAAQQKIGLFLPGYSLDQNVGWLNSNTPQRLVNEGVLNGYRLPRVPAFGDVGTMSATYTEGLTPNQPMERWVVIGHSLGGLLARAAEHPSVLTLLPQFNVELKGIVTLGTPHQGMPIARNYTDPGNVIPRFSQDVVAGPDWEIQNGSFPLMWPLTQPLGGLPFYQLLANSLGLINFQVTRMLDAVSRFPVSELAPGSNFLNSMQSIPATVPHVSIGGVEYSPAVVRWAFSTDAIAEGITMSESDAATKFNDAKNLYNAAWDWNRYQRDYYILLWNITPCWLFPGSCNSYWQSHERYQVGMDAWGRGSWALNDIDNRWFVLQNDYLEATGSYQYWVACGGEQKLGVDPGADLPMVPYDPCDYGATGYWETVYYIYYYADKSDALVPQNRTKWFSYEGFANSSTSVSALRQGNISFDGGYNNSEMRYLNRPHPPYDASEPMQFGGAWIRHWIDQ